MFGEQSNRVTSPNFYYDASGNQTIIPAANPTGQQRYSYDAANRLVRVTDGSGNPVANYTYGASNQRLITEQGNERTYYVAAGGSVLAEYTEATSSTTPAWSQSYIYLGGRLLATVEASGGTERVEYHHPDRLGTRLSTNQSDSSMQEQATLPFGTALGFETTGTSTSRRFTSYDRSQATGLDYAVNRSYDSLQGRFTQVDPIDMDSVDLNDPQTLNLYAYCANDPVNCVDPDGLGIISFFKKLGKAIWKVLTSKVFIIAASIALAVISFGASAGWWALSSAVTQSVSLGSGITLSATTTQATALGWIAAGVSTALAIPALTSVSGILQRVASFGFGQALGGFGGAVGMGGTPDWNDDANEFAQRNGGRRDRNRSGGGRRETWRRRPDGSWVSNLRGVAAGRRLRPRPRPAMVPAGWPRHHIFPQSEDLAREFARRGINIHDHITYLPPQVHSRIHGYRGGIWNQQWRDFFRDHPNATRMDILRQGVNMMQQHDLWRYPRGTYR